MVKTVVCVLLISLTGSDKTIKFKVARGNPQVLEKFIMTEEKVPFDGVFIPAAGSASVIKNIKRKIVVLLVSTSGIIQGKPIPLLRTIGKSFFTSPPGTQGIFFLKPVPELEKIQGGEKTGIICKEEKP